MLYEFLISILIFICLLLVLIILIQQGKSSMGLGSLGGGAQMLFGGSGGQDMFQKVTWVLGALFMGFSLILALMKSHTISSSRYVQSLAQPVSAESARVPEAPAHESTPSTPE
jgi:preprotein translocase subunit SecG